MSIIHILATDGFITVNKRLIKELGLAEAVLFGIMCSEYSYWEAQGKLLDGDKFYLTIDKMEEYTGLSYYKQQKAIIHLEDMDFISTTLLGTPAVRYFKINEEAVLNYFNSSFQMTQKLDLESLDINNKQYNNKENNTNTNVLVEETPTHKNEMLDSIKKDITETHNRATNSNKSKSKFLGSISQTKEDKPKKENLYQKCVKVIDEQDYSKDPEVRELLIQYLNLVLEQARKGDRVLYLNQWRGMLNKLKTLTLQGNNTKTVIQQSLDKGYRDFFPINHNFRSMVDNEYINEVNNINNSTDISQQVHLTRVY